jgi:Holliday junction resolvase RusA-like endonuclease
MVRAAESDGGCCSAMSGACTEPVEIVIDLPAPPSVNRLWRSGRRRVFRSRAYTDWIRLADAELMARRQMPKKRIDGPFAAHITLSQKVRGDVDNRIKGLLDFLQSREIIRNDSDCQRLTVERGEAEAGCRLTLREWRNTRAAEKGRGGRYADHVQPRRRAMTSLIIQRDLKAEGDFRAFNDEAFGAQFIGCGTLMTSLTRDWQYEVDIGSAHIVANGMSWAALVRPVSRPSEASHGPRWSVASGN